MELHTATAGQQPAWSGVPVSSVVLTDLTNMSDWGAGQNYPFDSVLCLIGVFPATREGPVNALEESMGLVGIFFPATTACS